MSKSLPEFDFKRGAEPAGKKYDQYLDGGIWLLEEEDLNGTGSFDELRGLLRTRAWQLGLKLRSRILKGNDGKASGLVIQTFNPEEPDGERTESE